MNVCLQCSCTSNEAEVFLRKALRLYTQVLKLHLHFKSFIRSGNMDKFMVFTNARHFFDAHHIIIIQ